MPSFEILQCLRDVRQSASSLMDDPLGENESTADYYLTMHCFMLVLFLVGILNKYVFDVFDFMRAAWPVKSENFRNPLSLPAAAFFFIAIPLFVFWRRLGKTAHGYSRFPTRHYQSISFASSIGVNLLLLFVAGEVELPEISLVLGLINFYLWARWSVRKYAAHLKDRVAN